MSFRRNVESSSHSDSPGAANANVASSSENVPFAVVEVASFMTKPEDVTAKWNKSSRTQDSDYVALHCEKEERRQMNLLLRSQ